MPMRDRPLVRRMAAGFVAAALGMVLQYVLHRLNRDLPFPPFALADWAIRITPGDLATEAIERLGHFARLGLATSMLVTVLVAGAVGGMVRSWAVVVVVVGVTFLAALLAPIEPGMRETLVGAAAGGAMAGLAALVFVDAPLSKRRESAGRRRLLLAGTAGAVVVMIGVSLGTRRSYRAVEPPVPGTRLVIASDPVFDATTGISPLITPNADHYTVDINITRPRQDASTWRLDVSGLVATPRKLAYVDLAALPVQERAIYLQCISNVANGDLMGNATWTVATLLQVLELAGGPLDGTDTVVARAVDGYHESYPVAEADAIHVALAMGAKAIPNDHGSPMRLLYAGHYGMRSIKWVTALEVIRGEEPGYWQNRAWDETAPLRMVRESTCQQAASRRAAGLSRRAWHGDRLR